MNYQNCHICGKLADDGGLRDKKFDFFGCSQYPTCKHTEPIAN